MSFVIGVYQLQAFDSNGKGEFVAQSDSLQNEAELNQWYLNQVGTKSPPFGKVWGVVHQSDPRFFLQPVVAQPVQSPIQPVVEPTFDQVIAYEKEQWLKEHKENADMEAQFKSYVAAFVPRKR